MKLLLDTCLSALAKNDLHSAGYDVVWIGARDPDPGDDAILAEAHRDERILITLDKDFGELAIVRGLPHHGIIRLVNLASTRQAAVVMTILQKHAAELLAGAIVTAEPGRLRIRPPSAS